MCAHAEKCQNCVKISAPNEERKPKMDQVDLRRSLLISCELVCLSKSNLLQSNNICGHFKNVTTASCGILFCFQFEVIAKYSIQILQSKSAVVNGKMNVWLIKKQSKRKTLLLKQRKLQIGAVCKRKQTPFIFKTMFYFGSVFFVFCSWSVPFCAQKWETMPCGESLNILLSQLPCSKMD